MTCHCHDSYSGVGIILFLAFVAHRAVRRATEATAVYFCGARRGVSYPGSDTCPSTRVRPDRNAAGRKESFDKRTWTSTTDATVEAIVNQRYASTCSSLTNSPHCLCCLLSPSWWATFLLISTDLKRALQKSRLSTCRQSVYVLSLLFSVVVPSTSVHNNEILYLRCGTFPWDNVCLCGTKSMCTPAIGSAISSAASWPK